VVKSFSELGSKTNLGKGNWTQLKLAPENSAIKVNLKIGEFKVLSVSQTLSTAPLFLKEIKVK